MKVRDDDTLEGANLFVALIKGISPISSTFCEHLQRWVLYTGLVHKFGCEAAMKVRDDDTLEGAHSFVAFFRESPPFCAYFFGNTYRYGFYTLGWCTKLAVKQP